MFEVIILAAIVYWVVDGYNKLKIKYNVWKYNRTPAQVAAANKKIQERQVENYWKMKGLV